MGIKIDSIIFLGTGGDSFVIGRQLRTAGGIIFRINENQFHIDPGPGALHMAKLCAVNLRATTAIFVSTNELYHCNDINAVIDAMTYGGFDKMGILIAPTSVINGSETEPPSLMPYYKNCLERYIVVKAGQKVGINEIEIKILKTKHNKESIGFKFFTSKFTLTYTGDTSYSIELIEEYKNSNILILNMRSPEKETNSLSKKEVIEIIKRVNPRLAIIQHFGIKMLEADPLYVIRDIQKITGVQTIAAKDGLVINPVSYSASTGQKTLTSFSLKDNLNKSEDIH